MHTKSILIDDRLSLIGSFNWDMRSAYLDTELMLLVDCPALNAALREQTEEMMRQSRLVSPDGTETAGAAYIAPERSPLKAALQSVIRILIRPFRFVLQAAAPRRMRRGQRAKILPAFTNYSSKSQKNMR